MGLKEDLAEAAELAGAALDAEVAGQGEQGEQGDGAPEPRAEAGGKPAEQAPRRLKIQYRKQEVELPEDEVQRLAAMGFDYSTKMHELGRKKKELEIAQNDAQLVKDFNEYRAYLRQNPELASAVSDLTRRYDEERRIPKFQWEDATPAGPPVDERTTRRLDGIEQLLREQLEAAREKQLDAAVRLAVNSRPTLSATPKLAEVAAEKLAALLSNDPSLTPEAGAALVEEDARKWLDTLAASNQQARQKQDDKARFGTTERPANLPAAQASPSKVYTHADLQSGAVARAVDQYLRGDG